MSKLTCIVLCVVAMTLNSIFVRNVAGQPSGPEDVNTILFDCAKENGVTDDEVQAVLISQVMTTVNPCFFDCLLKRAGFLNDKGEYDQNTGLSYVRHVFLSGPERTMVEDIVKKCESVKYIAVNGGDARCERGALVAACFQEQI